MRVPVSWLREFCPTDLSPEELGEVLTTRGAKVEGVHRPWEGLDGVVVARVLEVQDHPNSDKLCLARVQTGDAELEVVVGVRNMQPGDLVPLAPPGARVPALPEPLGQRKIRGVVSNGMLCSPRELGISGEHLGILVLPPDTPLGADVKSAFGLDDAVLDIEVKANRPDLLSVVGVAREAAAALGVPLALPDVTVLESAEPAAGVATVEIRDLGRCPRYLARIIRDVRLGPSPIRMQARLTASGMRPLSNVVDATNYVMLEMGQPLHPFDMAKLYGPGIVVRTAAEGERLETLDGVDRELTPEDLVIADLERGVAIAGVMGSEDAEVSAATRDVLLESAYFERTGIARTSRRLGLRTEASARFERGTDPENVSDAAARAAALIATWSGGSVLAGPVSSGWEFARRHLTLRPERASLILGVPVTAQESTEALSRIGISATSGEGPTGEVSVEVPGWRPDLELEVDLIEEVIRVQGYDRVGATMPRVTQAGGVPESYRVRSRARESLVRGGLREVVSHSFASRDDLDLLAFPEAEAVRVANPLAADQAYLRPSLVPGLLRAVRLNVYRQGRGAALFETGHVFRLRDLTGAPVAAERETDRPVEERESVAGVLAGPAGTGYPREGRDLDFLDAKGALEGLLGALSVADWNPGEPIGPPLHPGRSASVMVGGRSVGLLGELHPRLAEQLDLPARTAVFEVDLSTLAGLGERGFAHRDVPRFPPVRRDLAFVVPAGTPAGAVLQALRTAGGELVDRAELFDVFSGGPIGQGRKSLAFSVDFRAPDRTLTDEEVEPAVRAIVERLGQEFDAELRAG